ncbi:10257_t:CDS:2 [Entrophospora sp. SA101]|nr:10257_t:CDS:2 [Entrophospora sp. SA101]
MRIRKELERFCVIPLLKINKISLLRTISNRSISNNSSVNIISNGRTSNKKPNIIIINSINGGNIIYPPSLKLITNTTTRSYSSATNKSSFDKRNISRQFTWQSFAVFIATGIGLFFYFKSEKEKMVQKKNEAKENRNIGSPKIGGPFELLNQDGKVVTDKDFLGKYILVYFGFTHCPDVCPEELDKMTEVTDAIRNDPELKGIVITPIFISCDPHRDTVEVVREYLKDFHKDMVGLTGSFEKISKVAKAYRVYFSKPPNVKEGEQYLVDHSIFFYLMNPNGEFVDAYGKSTSAKEVYNSVKNHIKDFTNSSTPIPNAK